MYTKHFAAVIPIPRCSMSLFFVVHSGMWITLSTFCEIMLCFLRNHIYLRSFMYWWFLTKFFCSVFSPSRFSTLCDILKHNWNEFSSEYLISSSLEDDFVKCLGAHPKRNKRFSSHLRPRTGFFNFRIQRCATGARFFCWSCILAINVSSDFYPRYCPSFFSHISIYSSQFSFLVSNLCILKSSELNGVSWKSYIHFSGVMSPPRRFSLSWLY